MKIVHYIPTIIKTDIVSDELLSIVNVMRDYADVRLVAGKESISNIFGEEKPDLIHVHGCWDYHASRLIQDASQRGIATVVSTHGGFTPFTMTNEKRLEKRARMLVYQNSTIKDADAVVISTKEELDNFELMKIQKNTQLVPAYLLNSKVKLQEVVGILLSLYRKVIDSRYRNYLTNKEKDIIRRIVHIGCSQPDYISKSTNVTAADYESLTDEQWRRLLFYAKDEHIEDIFVKGCRYEGLTIPDIDVDQIPRFDSKIEKNDGVEYAKEIAKTKSSLKHKVEQDTNTNEKAIRNIIYLIADIKEHVRRRSVSMRHFTTLFRLLQTEDYDEDKLNELLGLVNLRKPMQRILCILHDDLYLSEGFLPIGITNDSKVQETRKLITLCKI